MSVRLTYSFSAKVWKYSGTSGWHFVSLPKRISKEIRNLLQHEEEGWGRLKARACINETEWPTAIWYDTKHATFILPIKAEIRKKKEILQGDTVSITLVV